MKDSALIRLEEEAILKLGQVDNCIISGVSVVYSEKVMEHLKKISKIVFWMPLQKYYKKASQCKKKRDSRTRQELKELLEERMTLYWKYADFS